MSFGGTELVSFQDPKIVEFIRGHARLGSQEVMPICISGLPFSGRRSLAKEINRESQRRRLGILKWERGFTREVLFAALRENIGGDLVLVEPRKDFEVGFWDQVFTKAATLKVRMILVERLEQGESSYGCTPLARIVLPRISERKDDLIALSKAMLAKYKVSFSSKVCEYILFHPWTYECLELKMALSFASKRAISEGRFVLNKEDMKAFQDKGQGSKEGLLVSLFSSFIAESELLWAFEEFGFKEALARFSGEAAMRVVEESAGNISLAGRKYKVPPSTLRDYLRRRR